MRRRRAAKAALASICASLLAPAPSADRWPPPAAACVPRYSKNAASARSPAPRAASPRCARTRARPPARSAAPRGSPPAARPAAPPAPGPPGRRPRTANQSRWSATFMRMWPRPDAAQRSSRSSRPLDLHLVAQILERGHQVQRRVPLAHPPAPGLRASSPAAQAQAFGQRVARLPLGRPIAARAVPVAPLPLEHQRRALRPARTPGPASPAAPPAAPPARPRPAAPAAPSAAPSAGAMVRVQLRGELDVHRLLQRLQPGGQGVVGLGRKAAGRQRQRLHQRRRLGADLGQQHLRARRRSGRCRCIRWRSSRRAWATSGGQQGDPQQLELGLPGCRRRRWRSAGAAGPGGCPGAPPRAAAASRNTAG